MSILDRTKEQCVGGLNRKCAANVTNFAKLKVSWLTDVKYVLVKCHITGDGEAKVSSRRIERNISVSYLNRG